MSFKKKTWAALTAMALAASSLASLMVFADDETESTATLTADTSWYDSGDYTLYDAEDLAGLAELVNGGTSFSGKTVTIANDINCGGAVLTPIGTYSSPFEGTFNGGYYTISNAEITNENSTDIIWLGVFGCVNGGTIEQVKFDSISITNTSSMSNSDDDEQAASGVAVGILGTDSGGTVDNVTVLGNCTVMGVYRTGGVVGSSRDTTAVISNCTNNAKVTGTGNYTGGIVGAAHNIWWSASSNGTQILTCNNYGAISGTSEVGGIAGYTDRAIVTSCKNYGSVTGTGNYGTGGIVGCDIYNAVSLFRPTKGSTITSCVNEGSVSAPRVGGILSSYVVAPGDSQPSSNRYSTITGCTNTGAISSSNNTGICGAIYGAPISYANGDSSTYVNHIVAKIEGCYVGGTVEGASVPDEDADDEEDTAFNTFISPSSIVSLSGNTRYTEESE